MDKSKQKNIESPAGFIGALKKRDTMSNRPLQKKEICAAAGISPRTMQRNRDQWRWLESCRTAASRRPTYNRTRVEEELRRRRII